MAIQLALLGWLLASTVAAAEIRVVGSDLLGESFTRAVAGFARQNDAVIKLELRGTRPDLVELAAGHGELGLFLLPAGETPPGEPLVSRVIGYQVAVVMVPAASPLRQVTVAQLRGMFALAAGETFSRWGELNLIGEWTSRPIALRALAPAAGLAFPLFQHAMLADGEAKATVEFPATEGALIQRLLAAENTIGVTGMPAADVAGLRVLALAASPSDPAYAPTVENVHNGSYPLRMPLYVVFPRPAAPALQLFLKFLLSDTAAAALAPAHFVPLPVGVRNRLVFELEEMR